MSWFVEMFKTCFVHIGVEKTGTTSIQRFLAQNRQTMLRDGFFYPASLGLPNHVKLPILVANPQRREHLQLAMRLPRREDESDMQVETIIARFASEVTKIAPSVEKLVLSSEYLHSQITTVEEMTHLRQFLSPYAKEIKIIVYLRRQDQLAASRASTALKLGHTKTRLIAAYRKKGRKLPYYYDYKSILHNYGTVFGAQNCNVRLFEASMFVNGDLIDDFASAINLPLSSDYQRPARENSSLTVFGQRLLAEMNNHIPREIIGTRNPMRSDLGQIVEKYYAGKALNVTRQNASDFYSLFKEDNLSVKSEFFPTLDRADLFDESFDAYPVLQTDENPTFAQACEAAAKLWMFQCDRLEKQRMRLARHEASLKALKSGLQTDMRAAARALQSDQPQQKFEVLLHLFNGFCRLGDMDMAVTVADRAVTVASPSQARLLRSRLARRLTRYQKSGDDETSEGLINS